ncbi:hypothetical protein DPMN_151078 [Dreissena polymorpha]|uniref:DNA 3'-5' helicase n=2 Tax=Dreissena polymorpha TaxID=45954 RepID=A0A9D4J6Y4_DREPO|nr:hypothetical protein DPMN_151078 [Dreissena polymorpha]
MFRVENTNLTSGHLQIDIADVRLVVHWGAPRNPLSYWQEVGRAGRDGKPSLAVVYPYGRSLVGDSGLRETFKSVECLRLSVLKTLLTKEMGESELCVKEGCVLKNCSVCECDLCQCCLRCCAKCGCVDVIGVLERFFI